MLKMHNLVFFWLVVLFFSSSVDHWNHAVKTQNWYVGQSWEYLSKVIRKYKVGFTFCYTYYLRNGMIISKIIKKSVHPRRWQILFSDPYLSLYKLSWFENHWKSAAPSAMSTNNFIFILLNAIPIPIYIPISVPSLGLSPHLSNISLCILTIYRTPL